MLKKLSSINSIVIICFAAIALAGTGWLVDYNHAASQADTPSATVVTATASPPKAPIIRRFKDLEFMVAGCAMVNGPVVCDFVVTNLGQDLENFKLVGSGYNGASEMYDNFGQDYRPVEFQIGSEADNLVKVPRLISGVPMPGKVIFQDVDPAMSSIPLLLLKGSAGGKGFNIAFRNIPLERSEAVATVPTPTSTPLPAPPLNLVERYEDLEFNLVRCAMVNGPVVCDFVVTNLGQDLENFKLVGSGYSGASEMYDNFGQDYRPVEFQIGSEADNLVKVPRLLSGVPMPARVFFQSVDPAMSSIPLLLLKGSAGGKGFNIAFRNIPLERSEAVATVPTPTSSLTPTPTLGLVQRYKGLEFNLTRCDLIGTQIRCDFNVTNLGRDLEGFRLVGSGYSGASEMYDDLGQVYAPIEFQVANHRGNLVELPRLLSGVPVQGRMFFQNVDPAARRLSLLQLNGRADGGRFTLEFQNIPLTPPIIPPATVEPLPSPELIPVNMIDRYKDLEFNLVGCGLTGTQVVCDFVVTNLGRDLTTFKLVGSGYSGASEMYDNFGQDYRPVEFQIGDRADNLIKVPRLISGLAVQGKVTFQDVEPAMNSISLLQLNGSAGSDSFYIKFKNIPVQQVANVH